MQFLINLSSIAILQGHYTQGESTGQAALILARDIGFLDAISVILTNMGGMALELKDYAKAEAYISEALEVARRIEDKKMISVDLASLGNLAVLPGEIRASSDLFARSLTDRPASGGYLASECGLVGMWRTVPLSRFHERGVRSFQEALTVSAPGNQEVIASALYGLARVAAVQRNGVEAQRLGRESLHLFESMGNRMKEKVKAWLQEE